MKHPRRRAWKRQTPSKRTPARRAVDSMPPALVRQLVELPDRPRPPRIRDLVAPLHDELPPEPDPDELLAAPIHHYVCPVCGENDNRESDYRTACERVLDHLRRKHPGARSRAAVRVLFAAGVS